MNLFTKSRLVLLTIALATPLAAAAQNSSGFGKLDLAPPTGTTPDEIIKKFGALATCPATVLADDLT